MKKLLLGISAYLLSVFAYAQEAPLWMRNSAISPDGTTIAFCYKGDIFTVPVTGGRALQITSHPAYDTDPVWSPDGKQIAFASDRMGSMDVYIVDKEGGAPTRLTTFSGTEKPVTFKDKNHILFLSNIRPSAEDAQFPSGQFQQVYEVSVQGGRPKMCSSMPMEDISVSADGKQWLYHDKKGYEDPMRKHHTSSITRDIWLYQPETNAYQRLTTFKGEDRTPVWAPDGRSFYYLSEEKGSFNVYKRPLTGGSAVQLTHHTKNPVRSLTASRNGLLCYNYDGELYTLKEGGKPQKVEVRIVTDKTDRDVMTQIRQSGATEIALSPDAKEIAFVLHGDVYVTSTEYKTTKQVTNTPEQERNINFSPDGRSIVYASERDGVWQIYRSSLVKKEEKQFTYATELKEEKLIHSGITSFQPQYSPDGKEIAFLENRTSIRVLNLAKKSVRTVMDGKYEYSYSDGDQSFEWSPDSKWILTNYIGVGGWNNKDIALVNASGNGEIHNLTESGYSDRNAKWVLDGKAMIWESDRAGFRSHGSWGAESDIYIMFFDLEAYERFRMSKEELALADAEKAKTPEAPKKEEQKEKSEPAKDKKNNPAKGKGGKERKGATVTTDKKAPQAEKKETKALVFDLENREDRIVRLTVNSSRLGDAVLSLKGDKLYYLAAFESGMDLWEHDLKENRTKIVMKGVGGGQICPDKRRENIYLCSRMGIKKVTLANGATKPVSFEAVFTYQPYAEREYIFNHVWQQVKDKFYVADLQGTDWEGYRKTYSRFLPYINNNYDFAEVLSEMLGELNASHTGARYQASSPSLLPTASLGVFYDEEYTGDGLKIKEIIAKGPLTLKKNEVTAGCIIERIDGQKIAKGTDYFPLLEGKSGRNVRLSVLSPAGKRFDVTVKAISMADENGLLYKRWVKRCRDRVDKLSGGRVGYVHVKGMDSQSFREVYSELLGRCRNKEAVIVDTRHNGGGWLHDDLATLLSGKEYQRFVPRGQYIGSDPFNKWLKSSCVLVCEDNYSNAHGFPWVYKELKIGKLIGAPVPGTMTAVWWEPQIDPSIVFGIPEVGCMDMRGQYAENHQLEPDIEVYNAPEESLAGKDRQLETAVQEMLKGL